MKLETRHFTCTHCDAGIDSAILDLHGTPHDGCPGKFGLWVGEPDNAAHRDESELAKAEHDAIGWRAMALVQAENTDRQRARADGLANKCERLADKWSAVQYTGDYTQAVYQICAKDLRAAIAAHDAGKGA